MAFFTRYPQLKIIQDLARKRKTQVFLVGGFIRNFLLGKEGGDFDFAVERNALKFAEAFAREIKGAYVLLDQEHGCARVVKKNKGEILTFDFAAYRAKTFAQDLNHRDFTVNALSVNLLKVKDTDSLDDVVDDFKTGLKDLKARRVRMSNSRVFQEDPLRVLRAFSLQAVLGFKIEPATLKQIKKDLALIRRAAYERVRDEFFKILESERASDNIRMMDKLGLLEKIIPQVSVMYNCQQGGYHHLDVWPHSLEVLTQMEHVFAEYKNDLDVVEYVNEKFAAPRSRRGLMKLAALLHDVGKPDTKRIEGERMTFHSHEHVGKRITRVVAKMLKLSKTERYALEDMVLWHLRPGYLSNYKQPSERMIFRYFRDTKDEAAAILLLSLADQRSTRGPLTTEKDQRHHENICVNLTKRYFEMKKQKPFVRLIDGNDLIKTLKLKPSPVFGAILEKITEQQSLGKITTKDEALALARQMVPQKKGKV
jgi:putative nucleotidyltransferase with HDIG domain